MKFAKKYEHNLRYLAAFLNTLPDDYDAFHMGYFCGAEGGWEHDPAEVKGAMKHCGTVACAVGHLSLLGFRPQQDESHGAFSERVLGLPFDDEDSLLWAWCFSGNWANIDNTPKGAAKRITFLLTASEEEVGKATRLFDDFTYQTFLGDTIPEGKEEIVAIYSKCEPPSLDSLDQTKLPREAGLFAARERAGEPILSFLADRQ